MVEVKNITKRYGDIKAVDGISFTVNPGEILGFLGPNGAGKSTTMNIITGYLSSDSGTVTIDGYEILDNPKEAKKRIGYLPEIPPLYQDMTVIKYLEFMFDLKRVKLPKEEHIKEVIEVVKIKDVQTRLIKNLSKGYKQRVGFAQALLGNPPVLILDEPTVGLDPKQIIEIRNIIKKLGKKHTIIFSSHVLSEVSAICDRIIVISNGKIVADNKTDELSLQLNDKNFLDLEIEGSSDTIIPVLESISNIEKVEYKGNKKYQVEYSPESDVRKDIFFKLSENNIPLLTMKKDSLSLEESFLKLTEESSLKGESK